jgi:hypothetical protein
LNTSLQWPAGSSDVAVSIIVPVRDAIDDLPALTRALARQTFNGGRSEILFVDNGSDDGSVEWLQDNLPPQGRLLCSPRRHNAYAARNMGVEHARGEMLAFTDTDCRPEDDWLERGAEALSSSLRVAGRIVVQRSPRCSLVEDLDASRFLRQQRYVRELFGATANLFVHRCVFHRVGLFDDRLVSGADHEFGIRAHQAGLAIAYAREAVVKHRARQQFKALLRKAHRVGMGFGQELHYQPLHRPAALARVADRLSLIGRAWQRDDMSARRRLALVVGHALLAVGTATGCAKGYFEPPSTRACRDLVRTLCRLAMWANGRPSSLPCATATARADAVGGERAQGWIAQAGESAPVAARLVARTGRGLTDRYRPSALRSDL